MSLNDRINDWAKENQKKLTVLYIIWCIGLITVAILFGAGVLELREINFDVDKIPTGFMDKVEPYETGFTGSISIINFESGEWEKIPYSVVCMDDKPFYKFENGTMKEQSDPERVYGC